MMDATGITAQIVYPNILGFGGQNAVKVDDELRLASVEIFNDAMAEMQADSGQRMFPMALLPWWDVKLAVKEIERAKQDGPARHQHQFRPALLQDRGRRATCRILARSTGIRCGKPARLSTCR